MKIMKDKNDQYYIEWEQVPGGYKRAWIQHRPAGDKDWAGTGRYLNVVRCTSPGHPAGNATDFPIFNNLSDEQLLHAFVHAVCGVTGCRIAIDGPLEA